MIESKLRSPHLDLPNPSPTSPPSPLINAPPPQGNQRRRQHQQNKNILPSSPRSNNEYDPEGVGTNLRDSLGILGFNISDNISERQVRRRYMVLDRKYHPDKNVPTKSGRDKEEATIYFQLINNAHQYLQDMLWGLLFSYFFLHIQTTTNHHPPDTLWSRTKRVTPLFSNTAHAHTPF